jgi:PAS domain S-box-containing protein
MLNDIISSQFDLKRLERLLKIQHAIDMHSIIAITDTNGTITYVNKKFCEISKYPEKELIGMNHRILKSDKHNSGFYQGMWKTISSGKVWKGEVCNKAKDESYYWVKTIIVPLLDDYGNPIEYISIRTDITKEKEIQMNLTTTREDLVKAERLSTIGELTSRLVHDTKNPLSVLAVQLELTRLNNKNPTEKDLEGYRRMEEAISKIEYLLNNSLDFVRTKSLNLSHHSLEQIIESAIDHIVLPDKIIVNKPENDVTIICDEKQLEILFSNIFTNAVQAIGDIGYVKIGIRDEHDSVVIEFEDSGPGVPDEIKEKIFEPLYTTKQQGTGLGLASCKKIVEQHHGNISIMNNPTRFFINIPKRQILTTNIPQINYPHL